MTQPGQHPWQFEPILRPGVNCWTAEAAVEQCGLLIDARNYYLTFYEAAKAARSHLLIAGWRFNSDVRLLRGKDAEEAGGDVFFLPFLKQLCSDNPDLGIHVLAWDFAINYANEWEWFQRWKFQKGTQGRIQFRFDDHHPVGASHHQKFVVIDGCSAFVGGLDFCSDDWDDRQHLAHHPERHDSGKPPHHPYHDLQTFLLGPAAKELETYFVHRWNEATGENLELPAVPPPATPPPMHGPAIAARRVALCRNEPKTFTDPDAELEIRALYRDAIAAARRLIYMENQYFSSRAVTDALVARLRNQALPHLEVAVVLPKQLYSWVEAVAMEPPRLRMLEEVLKVACETGHRFGLYYPVAPPDGGEEVPVLIHSKLLLVDDRFLTVGSANASNRSMGLDSELNVVWEAAPDDEALIESLRAVRVDLLAEHCHLRDDPKARARLAQCEGLVQSLDEIAANPNLRLRKLSPETVLHDRGWVRTLADAGFRFDPKEAVLEETYYETVPSLLRQGVTWFRDWLRSPDSKG